MSAFTERLASALASLRADSVDIPLFWEHFEKWIDAIPGSPNDLDCIEQIKKSRVFKMDLLLAYHLLGDTPLKKVLEERIKHCHVTHQEWEDSAHASFDIKRKR